MTKRGSAKSEEESPQEYSDGDSDECVDIEKVVGVRKNGSKTEYLVKFAGKAYYENQWLNEKAIMKEEEGKSILAKIAKGNPLPSQEPFFDPEYLKVDRILSRKDDSYLVKWMNLGYDQATYEKELDPSDIATYEKRCSAVYSVPSKVFTAVTAELEPVIEFPFPIENLQIHSIPALNVLLSNFKEQKPTELYSELGQSFLPAIAGFFYLLHNKYENHGPFMVAMPLHQLNEWNAMLRELDNMKTIVYTGSKDVRKKAREVDFMQQDNKLAFHILLTTPEILRKDEDILNDFMWQSVIVDAPNRAKGKLIKNVGSIVTITITHLRTRGCEVQKMLDVITQDPVQKILDKSTLDQAKTARATLQHATTKKQKAINDAPIPKIVCDTINTPMNDTQKREIIIALHNCRDQIKAGNFHKFSQKILRILTHPYINMYREYYNGTPYVDASTKMMVITRIIQETLVKETKILIITEYNTVADMIEDFCDEIACSFHRLSPKSPENEISEAKVLICDQLFTRLSLDTSYLPYICNVAGNILCVDGDSHSIINTLRLKMTSASIIRKTYKLECIECDESELYQICRKSDFSSIDSAKAEAICRRAVLTAYQPSTKVDVEKLITENSNSISKEDFLQDEFADLDFWGILLEEELKDPEFPLETEPKRNWTIRERNQIVRFASGLGIDRGELITKLSGVRITPELAAIVGNQILRFLSKNTRGNATYIRARQLLDGEEEEPFFDEGVWNTPAFRSELKASCLVLIKRIDFILHMRDDLSEVSSYEQLPRWTVGAIRDPPTDLWNDFDDRALIFGTIKYGFGNYDFFVLDDDPHITSLLISDGEEVQRFSLSERVNRLGDAVKRKREPKGSKVPTKSVKRSTRVQDDFGVGTEWTTKDKNLIRNSLTETGIPRTSDGKRDWETFRITLGFSERSAEEVEVFVEGYLKDCEAAVKSAEKGKSKEKEKDDDDDTKSDSAVAPKTADRVLKRVNALDKLREMFSTLSDEDIERHFGLAQDRRDLPEEFNSAMEVKFFKRFNNRGFGFAADILSEDPFNKIFDESKQPPALTADYKLIKRIDQLYDSWQKKSHQDHYQDAKKESRRRKPIPEQKKSRKAAKQEFTIPTEQTSYPVTICQNTVLESIGHVVYDRKGFHTTRYVYPAGFNLVKSFWSPTKANERCRWRCEILDEGGKDPLFRISCIDEPDYVYSGSTPTAPWNALAKEILKKFNFSCGSISGTVLYMLTNQMVDYLIRQLPDIDKCEGYSRGAVSANNKEDD